MENSELIKAITDLEIKHQLFTDYSLIDDDDEESIISAQVSDALSLQTTDHESIPLTQQQSLRTNEQSQKILEFMNRKMSNVLQKKKIDDLQDAKISNVILYAFYKDKRVDEELSKCSAVLFSALLAVFVSKKMMHHLKDMFFDDIATTYENQKIKMEEMCRKLMDLGHAIHPQKMRELLSERYIPMENDDSNKLGVTLLGLAKYSSANNFFSQISCCRVIEQRWKPNFRCSKTKFLLNFVSCGLLILNPKYIHFEAKLTYWEKWYYFMTSPCGKFVLHTMFYGAYVVFLGVCLHSSIDSPDDSIWNIVYNWRVFILTFWHAMFLLELVLQFWNKKKRQDTFYQSEKKFMLYCEPVSTCHVIIGCVFHFLSLLSIIMEVVSTTTSYFMLAFVELLLFVLFIFSAMRSLRILTVDRFFGSIVITIVRMSKLFLYFFVVIATFWMVYGFSQMLLINDRNSTDTIVWKIFINGAFEIFGEIGDLPKNPKLPCFSKLNGSDASTPNYAQCQFRAWMVPVSVFVYTMVMSVLVINILTAMIDQKYDSSSVNTQDRCAQAKFNRLYEYESKPFWPTPFTILNLMPRNLKNQVKHWFLNEYQTTPQPKRYFFCKQSTAVDSHENMMRQFEAEVVKELKSGDVDSITREIQASSRIEIIPY